jgi:hypothetical protein
MVKPIRNSTQRKAALVKLVELHDEVDHAATALAERHADRLQCGRGCSDCCTDELGVYEVEAERIRSRHAELLREGTPHPAGRCAFLDADHACRVYAERPYVCRTQGLPLRWFANPDPESAHQSQDIVELRDICPLNLEGPALSELADDDCWLLGPFEARLESIAGQFDCDAPERIPLRTLFHRSGS